MSEPLRVSTADPCPDQTEWFVQRVHPHDAAVRSYMRASFSGLRDLDDVMQESYLRVWKRHALRPIKSIKAFLKTVARNVALDTLRRQRASPFIPVTEIAARSVIEDKPGADETASINQEYAFILEAIDALPNRGREVIILRKLNGLSPGETARKLGISEETVHVHARRSLRRIQDYLLHRGVIRRRAP